MIEETFREILTDPDSAPADILDVGWCIAVALRYAGDDAEMAAGLVGILKEHCQAAGLPEGAIQCINGALLGIDYVAEFPPE